MASPAPAARPVPAATSGPDHVVDETELDEKWGFKAEEPFVGHGAPPVVAVLVTKDPGDWFERTLESLADQDYESLSVLVIDNGGRHDPTERIADVLPSAFVKRLDSDEGLSAASNEVLTSVEGATFYLLMHDDVALEPNAVTALVAEAFRATGGIVGPKIVDWDDPRHLWSVGYSVDIYGFSSPLSEPGELDQSQHDTAREVFAVSGACMLVRSDLFAAIGGFTDGIPYFGEDIDLCWRAHIAGATVHLCPSAVVAHRGRFTERREQENWNRLAVRHEALTMLTNYEPLRLLRIAPVAVLLSGVDLLGSLVGGRFHRAGDIVASWLWNLGSVPSLMRARSRVKRIRRAHDAEYLPLMRQGSTRIGTLLRADEGENRLQSVAQAGRGYLQDLTEGSSRAGTVLALFTTVLVVLGARSLIAGPLPVIREFFDAGQSSSALLAQWWSGWREAGFGESAVAPGVVPGLGVVGTVLLGSVGLARRLLIVLPLFVGALGAWKLLLRTGSIKGRAAMLAAYALNPVVLNAMAEGRLQALVTYAAAPWLLRRTATAAGLAPFGDDSTAPTSVVRSVAGTALILAFVGSVSPLGAAVLVVCCLLLGLIATTRSGSGSTGRFVGRFVVSTVLALGVVGPWILQSVLRGDIASLTGMWTGRDVRPGAADLITGSVGPVTVGLFGWGLLVAAGYSLLAGSSWRFRWAIGGWVLALASWVVAISLVRVDAVAGAGVELVLVPAVLGLAISIAMGALAFEHDVVGSDFGVSQILSAVAVAGLLVTLVPITVASANGRWYQPEGGFNRPLENVDDGTDFRTVWIGDPDVLPLAGWQLEGSDGVGIATSSGLDPTVTQRYRLDGGAGVTALQDAIGAAVDGETARLGRVLAPMGVRYVAVIDRPAPQPFAPPAAPFPASVVAALREQLDLVEVELNAGLVLFEVQGAWPLRSDISDVELPGTGDIDPSVQLQTEAPAPPAVFGRRPGTSFTDELTADRRIAQSSTADPGWSLTVDGDTADRSDLFGWAQQFRTGPAGDAELRWSTSLAARGLQALQVASLIVLIVAVVRQRRVVGRTRRTRSSRGSEGPVMVVDDDGRVVVAEESRS
ncbi:MAG: glycosyltransferase family 2 protein [Actinomycetota bacterium]|nr:glycosyltransferase family 2 protein [Actinomycetota bacterium]